jgi:hypothetical protein
MKSLKFKWQILDYMHSIQNIESNFNDSYESWNFSLNSVGVKFKFVDYIAGARGSVVG